METSNKREYGFTHYSVGLLNYHFQRIEFGRGGSYIASPDWTVNQKATINPKNEKDNECFKWSIIAGLNYKIKEKENFYRGLIQIFHHIKETGKNLNKKILQLLLISYLYHIIAKK